MGNSGADGIDTRGKGSIDLSNARLVVKGEALEKGYRLGGFGTEEVANDGKGPCRKTVITWNPGGSYVKDNTNTAGGAIIGSKEHFGNKEIEIKKPGTPIEPSAIEKTESFFFENNKTNLTEDGIAKLGGLAKIIADHQNSVKNGELKINIDGFASTTGSASHNKELSDLRVEEVRTQLQKALEDIVPKDVAADLASKAMKGEGHGAVGDADAKNRRADLSLEIAQGVSITTPDEVIKQKVVAALDGIELSRNVNVTMVNVGKADFDYNHKGNDAFPIQFDLGSSTRDVNDTRYVSEFNEFLFDVEKRGDIKIPINFTGNGNIDEKNNAINDIALKFEVKPGETIQTEWNPASREIAVKVLDSKGREGEPIGKITVPKDVDPTRLNINAYTREEVLEGGVVKEKAIFDMTSVALLQRDKTGELTASISAFKYKGNVISETQDAIELASYAHRYGNISDESYKTMLEKAMDPLKKAGLSIDKTVNAIMANGDDFIASSVAMQIHADNHEFFHKAGVDVFDDSPATLAKLDTAVKSMSPDVSDQLKTAIADIKKDISVEATSGVVAKGPSQP